MPSTLGENAREIATSYSQGREALQLHFDKRCLLIYSLIAESKDLPNSQEELINSIQTQVAHCRAIAQIALHNGWDSFLYYVHVQFDSLMGAPNVTTKLESVFEERRRSLSLMTFSKAEAHEIEDELVLLVEKLPKEVGSERIAPISEPSEGLARSRQGGSQISVRRVRKSFFPISNKRQGTRPQDRAHGRNGNLSISSMIEEIWAFRTFALRESDDND